MLRPMIGYYYKGDEKEEKKGTDCTFAGVASESCLGIRLGWRDRTGFTTAWWVSKEEGTAENRPRTCEEGRKRRTRAALIGPSQRLPKKRGRAGGADGKS